MTYKDLEVWKLARNLSISIHTMTLNLPQFELFETGSQIRRSSKSIRANIVEGFGKKTYPKEFIKYIKIAKASCDETEDHLDTLFECQSLTNEDLYKSLSQDIQLLNKKITNFLFALESKTT